MVGHSGRSSALEPHQLYGLHRDGFAGHMHRTAMVSRFYLQVPPGTPPDLDDENIWAARSAITQPLQCGPLYLAGDAAHIVTPAGDKGMTSPCRTRPSWSRE